MTIQKLLPLAIGALIFIGCNQRQSDKKFEKSEPAEAVALKIDPRDYASRGAYYEALFYDSPEYDNDYELDYVPEYDLDEGDIRIPTKKGVLKFSTYDISEFYIEHYYIGSNLKHHYHLIEYVEDYESSTLLVSEITGKVDTLWGDYPVPNKQGNLICAMTTEIDEGLPNGFQIWQLQDDGTWKKTKEVDQTEWIAYEVRWSNDNPQSLLVEADSYNEDLDNYMYLRY